MNTQRWHQLAAVSALWTCLLVVTTPDALAGKPSGGVDPCSSASPDYLANWSGFPAYAYLLFDLKSYTHEVRIASRNGVCSKRLGDVHNGRGSHTSFAKTPDGSYVVAYDSAGVKLVGFSLGGAGETATYVPATYVTFRADSFAPDLSPDGTHLAYQRILANATKQLVIASLGDPGGSGDSVVQTFADSDTTSVSWAPWDRVYYNQTTVATGKRLQSVSPWLDETQTPDIVLQMGANDPLEIYRLFAFGRISSDYAGYDTSGAVPMIVFQGYYTTSIRRQGGRTTGTWCVAAYAVHASTKQFLIGSFTTQSSITGFYPSVTDGGTVLYEKSTAPSSSTCNATGYVGESPLATGFATHVGDTVTGSSPATLKNP